MRVPYADQGLTPIPEGVSDEQALFVGDILATGYWAADISEISKGDTVLIIGAGPTGICTLQCVLLKEPGRVIVCDIDPERLALVRRHWPQVLPLPDMYGKNLTFKTGGVDGCRCREILELIAAGKIDTTPLITHTFPLRDIQAAYDLFANKRDGVIKVAVKP